MNIVFLDFDGPMIPGRAYWMEGQTRPYVTKFDPVAVSLVNRLCEKTNSQLVIHSSWRRAITHISAIPDIRTHIKEQGLLEVYFHEELLCPTHMTGTSSRWEDITEWIADNGQPDNYVVIEDEICPSSYEDIKKHMVSIDFDEGFTWERYLKACELLGYTERSLFI